jgi:drug/metabolite transporter (DMT)-like permease
MTALNAPALRGGLLALLAAALFGVSTPLVQRLGEGLGAFSTAALLYGGAALVGALSRRPRDAEAHVRRGDFKRLLAIAAFGAVIGPVALAWGLQRTSGASASLTLTLESLFTAVLAWLLYRESMDWRVRLAMALLLAGCMAIVLDQGIAGDAQLLGLLGVLLATAAWGVDNTLSRALADRDPSQVVMFKAALGASATTAIAWVSGEPVPSWAAASGLLVVGATGYGLSLRLYLLAQRQFGAARTGSVFAFAPFIGAFIAFLMGDRSAGALTAVGGLLMLGGVLLHLAEKHEHEHTHDSLKHEHAHDHQDGHHNHAHDPMPAAPHSHEHLHEAMTHVHGHVPDTHHQHIH